MFDVEEFVADCRAVLERDRSSAAVYEVVARAVSEPSALIKALGEPARGQIQRIYHSPQLTVLNVIWAPKMTIFPHNHDMWAVIGIYSGREDNVFWRRLPEDSHRVEAAGAKSLCDKDAVPLGRDIIHSVTNPIGRLTGALHVYGATSLTPTAANGTRNRSWNGPAIRSASSRYSKKRIAGLIS